MLRPELMSLLKLSLHKSQVPELLNEIPKYPYFQIREFTPTKKEKTYHHHEKSLISNEREQISLKMNQIDENLTFIFQKLETDPDKIPKPADKADRFKIETKSIEDLIEHVRKNTETQKKELLERYKDIENCGQLLESSNALLNALTWLENYHLSSKNLEVFHQLKFGVYFISPHAYEDFMVTMENEPYPVVLDGSTLTNSKSVFFLIFHNSHEKRVLDILNTVKAERINEIHKYLTETGINISILEQKIKDAQDKMLQAEIKIEELRQNVPVLRAYLEMMENLKRFIHMEEQFLLSGQNQIVEIDAFVPTADSESISKSLYKKFGNKIRIALTNIPRDYADDQPEEETHEKKGHEKPLNSEGHPKFDKTLQVPTLYKPNKLIKPFQSLVNLYGTTNYGEIDPTFLVAITYPLIFGLLFGDFGHGLVMVILGLTMAAFMKKENKMRDFGFLLFWLGLGACLGGLIYGECFGYAFIVNGVHIMLFANPLENITTVFKFAILVGVIHINLGWAMKMFNYIGKKRTYLAFAEPFWKIILLSGGTYLIFTYMFNINVWLAPPYPILYAVLPVIPLILMKPIGKKYFKIPYLQHESIGELLGESVMDSMETYLGILSNVASYSRILALALAHMGLMLIITTMVKMFSGNDFLVIIVLIGGNLFVMVLEGVLAAIHTLRLHLYEFFGKFYMANGIRYQNTKITDDFSEIIFTENIISSAYTQAI